MDYRKRTFVQIIYQFLQAIRPRSSFNEFVSFVSKQSPVCLRLLASELKVNLVEDIVHRISARFVKAELQRHVELKNETSQYAFYSYLHNAFITMQNELLNRSVKDSTVAERVLAYNEPTAKFIKLQCPKRTVIKLIKSQIRSYS